MKTSEQTKMKTTQVTGEPSFDQPSTAQTMASNPSMTYGQAVGYSMGYACGKMKQREGGLSAKDWLNAGDDYAQGYRKGYQAAMKQEAK